jgi:pimeloyl-ACP methyl ester carboxylesterase
MSREGVVLVNGLWLGNAALWPLARRLRRAGFEVFPFSYPSVRNDLRANAECLQAFVAPLPAATLHWAGYSLGGVVIRTLFGLYPGQRPGRIVLLGSPQRGSRAATVLSRYRFGRRITGRSVAGLLTGTPASDCWHGRDIGVIAGNRSLGLGRLIADLPGPNDGTVQVAETEVPGARDRLVLPVAHSGLLLSPAVAQEIAEFLRYGAFRC